MKRTPLKRGKKKLKKLSEKGMLKVEENRGSFLMRRDFFISLYLSIPLRDRKCWSCGKYLSEEPRSYYFDHLLEKSSRPELEFERENIFICCLECHSLKTAGFPTDPHREAIEKAKEKFGIS